MRMHPKPTVCLKLCFLDGDRDAVAGHVQAQLCIPCLEFFLASSVTAGPVFLGDESDKFGWTPAG